MIFYVAAYRNSTTIESTWQSLIGQTHEEAVERMQEATPGNPLPPAPYESVIQKVQNIGHRVGFDSSIFPVQWLLTELGRYSIEYGQDGEIGASSIWPVKLFLDLDLPHPEIFRALETIFDAQEVGFTGNNRLRVIELILYAVNHWLRKIKISNDGFALGRDGLWDQIRDLLTRCETALPPPSQALGNVNPGGADVADIRRGLRMQLRELDGLGERFMAGGSLLS